MLFNDNLITDCPIRQKIRDFYRIDEEEAMKFILPEAEISLAARSRAWERARKMVVRIRKENTENSGIDALLNEYSLSSEEGVVLMCLAEALLRVPDKATQDKLIQDKIGQGAWSRHIGGSESMFVNASSWGLLLTGSMVKYSSDSTKAQYGILKRTVGKFGEPVIRKAMKIAMKIMGQQFVMGEDIEDATERAMKKETKGYVYSYDMLGEGARNMEDANKYYQAYVDAIKVIGKKAKGRGPRTSPGISVKLSAIHPRYEFGNRHRVLEEIVPKLKALALMAKDWDIGLTVDAEESERLDISLDIIEAVFLDDDLGDWNGFGLAVQAYQKRAIFVIDWLRSLTLKTHRKLMVRLVKGAYWDSEIKNAQRDGEPHFPVFTRKSSTDVSYHACANKLLEYRDTIYPQFATHNGYTASTILELAGDDKEGFEFQCLHGMGDSLYDQIVSEQKIQCRIYAPVGVHEDLLAYLVRRLLENGANSSFVNAIVDVEKPVEDLLFDPMERTQRLESVYNDQINLPHQIFGKERANSKGLDLTDINELLPLKKSLESWFETNQASVKAFKKDLPDNAHAVRNPANHSEVVGYHKFTSTDEMTKMLERADNAFTEWSTTSISVRAELLRKTADILEDNTEELIGLCIKEAGKIAKDGVDEIREAVDFCRYYAARAEELANDDRLEPRGVILCISPWNFPLAIFLGQVVAAVVTGNTVLAKPAEQTSLIAIRAVELMKQVGLPENVVQLVIARGPDVGNTLLPDERVKAVMFTGSTQTGTLISQILAERGGEQVPLIAETGGQNCMIVDSTALPEQVVDDVIASGFQSAGQRCSALRVLYIQEDIADNVIRMIKGALDELSIGDPALLSTDVGPVIDEKALAALNSHAEFMQSKGKLLFEGTLSSDCENGTYFAPRLYEIENINQLEKEVFGPCVHVIRFKADQIIEVVDQVNSTGFGLTMGIHSRIEERAVQLAKLSRAGNVYVNRNMIGAVVGVQPFGGRGLSGTGPKAGGPNYLPRLMIEKATPDEFDYPEEDPALETDDLSIDAAKEMMETAKFTRESWRLTDLVSRLSYVRQLLASIATVDIVDDLADNLEKTLKASRNQLINIERKMKKPVQLPGPTGESNTLFYEPRGTLVCFADKNVSFHYWTLSVVTALATGNVVIAVVSDLFYEEAQAFREKLLATGVEKGVLQVARLRHLEPLLGHEDLAGVVIESRSKRTAYVSEQLARRNGAILPVIEAEYDDNLISRMLTEKTVSIDTTASGGNTSLMTLTEDD
ncbi:bifunctional proline dehydrogenase/L-glutamate gamma-semialdehyde dehydrogenase PutA [Psychrosphaera aestuarii]|uniref:bifunctional proline dehydrogenase/L-glutamate gamma-semialdehyde dehydrogenase PutA n=1 Tax=Psychrosphaera aestuarii TaxID=1266052 RepID=UPI001B323C50|nr:bifunctional proline dehydrogenase/L-glutamate gamma-semialdehyde dehydrogenase PutA [Psychrosphaera aestuarii]